MTKIFNFDEFKGAGMKTNGVKNLSKVIFPFALLISNSIYSKSYQNKNLNEFLNEFHKNPAQVMDRPPYKEESANGSDAYVVIPNSADLSKDFLTVKDQYRNKVCKIKNGTEICAGELQGRAGIENNDVVEELVDLGAKALKNLYKMDQLKLQTARLSKKPWSDDYWPLYKGVLAFRYGDQNKVTGEDWKEYTDYVYQNPSSSYIGEGFDGIEFLSPAEKYDLLVGDKDETLTKRMLSEGRPYYDRTGKVETWMGICHGWAQAAYMLDRPSHKVNVLAADGQTVIPFFPSDIKALGSLLWANVNVYTNFSGGRCNVKDPEKDEVGRVIDQKCFDTNPGTWHRAVVNQIGLSDRSVIIDATYDYEVWNQPVYSYSYLYFNPETYETSKNFSDVAVDVNDFKKDKFKKYRHENTKKVVGVEMVLEYIAETQPVQSEEDGEAFDYVKTVFYRYDLELDNSGNILGGEWYSNMHPDFLWTPRKGDRALTRLDRNIEDAINEGQKQHLWKKGDSIPLSWRKYIPPFSKEGQPLGLIVEGLIERSRDQAKL